MENEWQPYIIIQLNGDIKEIMKYKIEKDLYEHTLLLNKKQNELVPINCGFRCVRSTTINRSYYSTYLYVKKYLINNGHDIHNISYYLKNKKKVITEHQQVIDELEEINGELSIKLLNLKQLRHKADYHPSKHISTKDVNNAISLMNDIMQNLKNN
ncbi:MAG: HEPN domain-containing protein [Methanosphaera sp.]|nr:HEPN domain-containing protein [Methanosphaera sp.]